MSTLLGYWKFGWSVCFVTRWFLTLFLIVIRWFSREAEKTQADSCEVSGGAPNVFRTYAGSWMELNSVSWLRGILVDCELLLDLFYFCLLFFSWHHTISSGPLNCLTYVPSSRHLKVRWGKLRSYLRSLVLLGGRDSPSMRGIYRNYGTLSTWLLLGFNFFRTCLLLGFQLGNGLKLWVMKYGTKSSIYRRHIIPIQQGV